MKYCQYCGGEMHDQAVVCVKCGCSAGPIKSTTQQSAADDTMSVVIKVFMIISCVAMGWMIIPLAWCIPMTVSVFKSLNNKQPISTGMKVCVLLFVSLVAGICLLCSEN